LVDLENGTAALADRIERLRMSGYTATLYNACSLIAMSRGNPGFAGGAASTQSAMLAVLMFGAVTIAGMTGRAVTYKVLTPIVATTLLLGGVIRHLFSGPEGYASVHLWVLAMLINTFGVVTFSFGAFAAVKNS